jgi:RHS repeat-associated protein
MPQSKFSRFTGKEKDEESSLNYFINRNYSYTLYRFLSVDAATFNLYDSQHWNRYIYVKNNPLRYIDPFGLAIDDPLIEKDEEDIFTKWLKRLYSWLIDKIAGVSEDDKNKTQEDAKEKILAESGEYTQDQIQNLNISNERVKYIAEAPKDVVVTIAASATRSTMENFFLSKATKLINFKSIHEIPEPALRKIYKPMQRKIAKDIVIINRGERIIARYEIPGKAGGKARAIYLRIVDKLGNTIHFSKTSYDVNGKLTGREIYKK